LLFFGLRHGRTVILWPFLLGEIQDEREKAQSVCHGVFRKTPI